MAHARQAAEAFILGYLKKLSPKGVTHDIYAERFKGMSDQDFDAFMQRLKSGEEFLVIFDPNFSDHGLSVERNLALAKELKHEFFEKIYIGKRGDCPAHMTPIKFLVVDLPMRRVSQLLKKKISIPEHNNSIDSLTGQVSGDSQGSKISYPEVQVMASMGLDNCIVEMMKYRGGDLRGRTALNAMISRHGGANLKTLSNYASGVESVKTLNTFLKAAMLKSTL